jgi:hypothetical protein
MKLNTGLHAQVIPFDEPRPPAFSDEALALRLAERHAGNLRYVAPWGKWLQWDGTRWQFDNTLRMECRKSPGCSARHRRAACYLGSRIHSNSRHRWPSLVSLQNL